MRNGSTTTTSTTDPTPRDTAGSDRSPASGDHRRVDWPSAGPLAHAGVRKRYPIEEAQWVWHPELAAGEPGFVSFILAVECSEAATPVIHVTADERYQLFVDGTLVGCGPDRSELDGWSFHSYRLDLAAGTHELRALVWSLGPQAPWAQISHRPGFLCAAEGEWAERIDTGTAPWRCHRETGIATQDGPGRMSCHVIGPEFVLHGARLADPGVMVAPVGVHAHRTDLFGHRESGWRLEPSELPEQQRHLLGGGRVRAVVPGDAEGPLQETSGEEAERYAGLLAGEAVTVPADTHVSVLLDFEQYHCGYARARLRDGADATVQVRWAESCYEAADAASVNASTTLKGQRDEIDGKVFFGYGDHVHHHGGPFEYLVPWWRSGRYLLVTIRTGAEALVIEDLRPLSSHYPVEATYRVEASDARFGAIAALCERGMRMCMHETHVDCPYYEQMNYVGDTRIQVLIAYTMMRDDRLAKRVMRLFHRSRWHTGLIAERCPSDPYQLSATYTLVWPLMVHDHALWRDDQAFVREQLINVRTLLEEFVRYENGDGLLTDLPGWSFIDWVPGWKRGMHEGAEFGASSIINLQYVLALEAQAELEGWYGDALLQQRAEQRAQRVAERIRARFWNAECRLLADDEEHRSFSEHAQCLALLCRSFAADHDRLLAGLRSEDLLRCTIYFSFYLLEAFARHGLGQEILDRFAFWNGLLEQGFVTTVESPEPSRSDCHAWGAHPLFHMHASLAGIRPDAPGFARCRIAPNPGDLDHLATSMPHPAGSIEVDLRFDGDACTGTIRLPAGLDGTFAWAGSERPLAPGDNTVG